MIDKPINDQGVQMNDKQTNIAAKAHATKPVAAEAPHAGHRERLRRTYVDNGVRGMHEHQILELLLTFALPRRDTNPLAHDLLKRYGTLGSVLAANISDLAAVPGMGENAAVLLSLAGELAQGTGAKHESARLNTPMQAMSFCRALLAGEKYETMYVISLDKRRKVIHSDRIGIGTLNETVVYPRVAVECALRHGASSVILTHNHPSGDASPSRADVETTKTVLTALTPIGITMHDHIIIGGNEAYSMVRGELIPSGEIKDVMGKAAEKEF
ncbi:MAG: DNA repair protein RadC [Clostridia bacterium]